MEKLLTFFCLAAAAHAVSCPLFAQTRNIYDIIMGGTVQYVESKWEYNSSTEMSELNYYNHDYCHYLLARANDKTYNLKPGKTTLFSRRGGDSSPFRAPSSYIYYRGAFVVDSYSMDTPYALPVRDGVAVSCVADTRQPQKTLKFMMEPYDTVYAVRGGIACCCNDENSLLVVHQDNTMSLYISMYENFVYPGENVRVGQPVGLADHGGQGISWFFLDRNRFSSGKASGYPYAHFIPFFSTSSGLVQPEEGVGYVCRTDDSVITLDMSKAAKKKYMKSKGK